jgi:hypothetical protein
MSLLMYDRYGGRKRRYKINPGRLIGLLDPWERKSLEFRDERVYDLWLLRRADPTVQRIVVRPEPLQFIRFGDRRSGLADLLLAHPEGVIYEALLSSDRLQAQRREEDLRCAAEVHEVRWRMTSADELAKHACLIANMDHIRQALVAWLDHELAPIRRCVIGALSGGPLTRAQLHAHIQAEIGSGMTQPTDVVVYRLFFERKLSFDLNRRYDDASVIEAV